MHFGQPGQGRFFQLFVRKKIENIVASALKSCIEKKDFFHVLIFFYTS